MSAATTNMVKSWVKVFLSAVLSAYLITLTSGDMTLDWRSLLIAGLVSLLPVVITWLDTSDERFGRVSGVADGHAEKRLDA